MTPSKNSLSKAQRYTRTWSRVPAIGYFASLLPLGMGSLMIRAALTNPGDVPPAESLTWGAVIIFMGIAVFLMSHMARIYELSDEGLSVRSRMGLGRRQHFAWSDIRGFRLENYNWGTTSSRTSRHRRLYVKLKDGTEQVIDSQIDHRADLRGLPQALRRRGYKIDTD